MKKIMELLSNDGSKNVKRCNTKCRSPMWKVRFATAQGTIGVLEFISYAFKS